jgi:3-deoxy-manno-octulosonate cytidylyltransferase (CMP-KDO synthetase)
MAEIPVLIPARMAATRLPGKPLKDIAGAPMIVQVWRRAMEAGIGPVVVACGEQEIADAVDKAGGLAVLTDPDHPSGSDRIFEALEKFDPDGRYQKVVNLQGDFPTLDPTVIQHAARLLDDPDVDIGTLAGEIHDEEERHNPNVVKAVISLAPGESVGRGLYFTRTTAPSGAGPHYHHVGIYAYRRAALAKFVALAPTPLEKREKLEQLRALENGMRIEVAVIDTVPRGVDTPDDLVRANDILAKTINC